MRPLGAKGSNHQPQGQVGPPEPILAPNINLPKNGQQPQSGHLQLLASENHQRPPTQVQKAFPSIQGKDSPSPVYSVPRTQEWCIYVNTDNLKKLGIPRHQPQDREGLFRTRRTERGHLGLSGGWEDTETKNTHSAIQLSIQRKPQARGLEGYGSISSAPPTPQRSSAMKHGQQEVKLASHWEGLEERFQKICLKEISFKELMVMTKGWNPTRQFRLLEEKATRIRENQATIQAIEEQLNQIDLTLLPSGSQGESQPNYAVDSHHSSTRRSVAKSHHSSQSQVVSRRRQGYKGKNKTTFSQRQKESEPMIQKLLDLVKEVHKSQ
ncbi:hypothetical protein O181_048103 [Austropuccinia psidii MF-1]|uniref:Uncharacterized protein n=1 Tax=Austropuccinia psidii MF-1 TaxID=1389203 RepID=A0A9Q3HK59_9BASI|nr:hypothetical protein [Austropuccinia psidii MF-1]